MTVLRDIAAIYEPKIDGFVSLPHKSIRNPKSPMIVWMQRTTWNALATHATRDGEFYIPCAQGMAALRAIVNEMEQADGKTLASGERAAQAT